MKKLFAMLCFLAVSFAVCAQQEVDQKKKIILHMFAPFAGFTLADLMGAYSTEHKPAPGAEVGIGVKYLNLSKTVDLRGELAYSQQGNKTSYGETSYYGSTSELRLNYLNIPVLAHYEHKTGLFAEAGLQPGILLSAKEKRTTTGMGGGGTTKTDRKKDMNGFDLGIPVGAGYVFKKKVAVGARFTPGLLNVVKNADSPKRRNSVFSARVSYIL